MNKMVISVFASTLLSTIMIAGFVRPVEANGTIYIRTDGSIFPSTAEIASVDNITYTFTNSNHFPVIVQRDNVVIDGDGYTLQGTRLWNSKGIDLTGRTNATIRNIRIKGFFFGIWLEGGSRNHVSGNEITENKIGIRLSHSSNNNIFTNDVIANMDYNVYLEYSSNNSILENNISAANKIWVSPIHYSFFGIYLHLSSSNNISKNNIENSEYGIQLSSSSNNSIFRNSIANNTYGILIWKSPTNTIYGNNLTNNDYGIVFTTSSGNTLYHDNFMGNAEQAYSCDSTNVWDSGYPFGGNYWSDYEDRYPNAGEIDESGMWAIPYIIDENNQDNYPLIIPWIPERGVLPPLEVPFLMMWQFWAMVTVAILVLAGTIYFLKKGVTTEYTVKRKVKVESRTRVEVSPEWPRSYSLIHSSDKVCTLIHENRIARLRVRGEVCFQAILWLRICRLGS